MSKQTIYNEGEIGGMITALAEYFGFDPIVARQYLERKYPDLADESKCANCQASMAMYIFEVDILDALLMLEIGRAVQQRANDGMMFTEANRIKVVATLGKKLGVSITCRTTQCRQLGLLAKFKVNGRQDNSQWVITERGWKFLSDLPVPRKVKSWRNRIEERFDGETITFSQVFQEHKDKLNRRKKMQDRTGWFEGYQASDWVHYAGVHQGQLL